MKASDADLIETLNALPDQDRADLLEFLTNSNTKDTETLGLEDRLEASVELSQHIKPKTKH